MRVAIVTNVIPDYRYQIFKNLLDNKRNDLRIFVSQPTARSCVLAQENLPLKYSPGVNLSWTTQHTLTNTQQREPMPIPLLLFKDVLRFRPQVIIAGDYGARSMACWLAARILGSRFVLWSEDIASSATGRSGFQHKIRRFIMPRGDAFLAWGGPAADYLRGCGVAEQRIFCCAQAIDNDLWMQRASLLDRAVLRHKLGLQGTVFLLVGRLLTLKGFANFLHAWSQLPPALYTNISAVIVGDGEQRSELEQLVNRYRLTNVQFAGAQPPEQLANYYAAADVFVFPSLAEVWGLVVNEALCFGLPVLASKFAGASQELMADRQMGKMFDPTDIQEFSNCLQAWAESPPARNVPCAHKLVGGMTFDKSVKAINDMLMYVKNT